MESNEGNNKKGGKYIKFFMMLGLSFIAMYITMYLNTYEYDHVYFSLTRFYMTCLGIAAMAVIMLSFMLNMYKNKKKNNKKHNKKQDMSKWFRLISDKKSFM